MNNPRRLAVIGRIDFDNVRLRAELDAITAQTATSTGLPICMATLVLDTAQLITGSTGLSGWIAEAQGTPIEWAFCANIVRTRGDYIVPAAATDPMQATNPLVTRDGFGSYAGVPVVIDGYIVGSHCILDGKPSHFTTDQLMELHAGAHQIASVLRC